MKPRWQKSSYSVANSGCVEVAAADGVVMVRDSKDPAGAVLTFAPAAWRQFIQDIRADRIQRR